MPTSGVAPVVRSDAARNNAVLLAHADELFARSNSPSEVTGDDVAAAASVGKGKLLRRFVDRAGPIRAEVDHRSQSLRDAVEWAPVPLGPNTPPPQRFIALRHPVLDFNLRNRALTQAVESIRGGNPYGPKYRWMHDAGTLAEVVLGVDASRLAHALFGSVRANLVEHLEGRRMSQQAIKPQLTRLGDRLTEATVT